MSTVAREHVFVISNQDGHKQDYVQKLASD